MTGILASHSGSYSVLGMRGEANEKMGRVQEALNDYSAALSLRPRHLPALLGRGRLAERAQRWAVARHDYLAAVKQEPDNKEALLGAAR